MMSNSKEEDQPFLIHNSEPIDSVHCKLSFSSDESDIEVGTYGRDTQASWWTRVKLMTLRARKKLADGVDGRERATLDLSNVGNGERSPKSKSMFRFCMYGSISAFTVLAFLLAFNLVLGISNYLYLKDSGFLSAWGKPGTSTEGLSWYPTDFTRDIVPIPCHSHNDYWRKVPLFSAIRAGCTGIEADVWHFRNDETLYVGHNFASLTKNRTFLSLYVNPLVEILERQNPRTEFYNGTHHGVFDEDPGQTVTLLVDFKTNGPDTWPYVVKQLEPLRERGWLTYVKDGELFKGPITVVGTGNTPFDLLTANKTYRDIFFDAPLDTMWETRKTEDGQDWKDWDDNEPGEDLTELEGSTEEALALALTKSSLKSLPIAMAHGAQNSGQGKSGIKPTDEFNTLNSFYASVSFTKSVGHLWRMRISQRQLKIIRGQIRGAHRRGLKVRYWDLPSWPIGWRNHVWDVLVKEGVDMLNVDDLEAASKKVW